MLEKTVKYLPLITALLIFLGYWNLSFFYEQFDLDIYNYVTTGEIITSFLPILKSIFITFFILFMFIGLFFFLMAVLTTIKNKEPINVNNPREDTDTFDLNHFEHIKTLFSKAQYKGKSLVNRILNFLFHLVFVVVGFAYYWAAYFLTFRIINLFINKDPLIYYAFPALIANLIAGILICLFIVSYYISKGMGTKIVLVKNKNFTLAFTLMLYLLINSLFNYKEAIKIKTGIPNQLVKFEFEQKMYSSDTSMVFIGQTQNYLFLHDLKEDKNLVFEISNIKNLEIRNYKSPN